MMKRQNNGQLISWHLSKTLMLIITLIVGNLPLTEAQTTPFAKANIADMGLQVSTSELNSQKVTLQYEQVSIAKLLKYLEQKEDIRFSYNKELLAGDPKVTVHLTDATLRQALDEIFKHTSIGYYAISGGYIVLREQKRTRIQETIAGTVTDGSTGETLPGVNIQVKGTTTGTASDAEGQYELSVESLQDTLVFSFVGYQTEEVPINGRTNIDVSLKTQAISGEEMVVVGYGTQQQKNLTGSVSSVDEEFINNKPITNSSQALHGIRGVYVHQASGQPGADDATIRIRGLSTLGDNSPLVLIDGVEGNLSDINATDIKNITVLKDAASTSIYGSRAANGVVLITTKSGGKGEIQVAYNGYVGLQEPTTLPDMITNSVNYMKARNQASINEGQPPPYTDEQIKAFKTGTNDDLYPNSDWFDIMFNPAPMFNHNLSFSGGSDQVNYRFSLGYLSQQGSLKGTEAKKYTLDSNISFNISQKLTAGFKLRSTYRKREESAPGASTMMQNGVARALPIQPDILDNGNYGDTWLVTPGHNVFRNPVAWAENGFLNTNTLHSTLNLNVKYIFPLNIEYKANFAVRKLDGSSSRFIPKIYIYNPKEINTPKRLRYDPPQRSSKKTNTNNLNTTFFQTLEWERVIAQKHTVNILGGFSSLTFTNRDFNAYIEGFLGNSLTDLNAGNQNPDAGGLSSESRLMSFFGRFNYNYSEKYLLEFNMRYDGSSRFARNNRWGFFPSISAGWRLSEEPFLNKIQSLSNLKLRASWGQVGNQNIPLYSFINTVDVGQTYTFGNNIVPAAGVNSLADPNIKWETTTMTNAGLDASFWSSKLTFNIDVYDKKSEDILARINVPAQVGDLAGPVTNLYSMSTKGIEFGVNYSNSFRDITFNIGGQISYVHNNVDFLNGDVQYQNNLFGNIKVIKKGYSVNSFYLYKATGIFQNEQEIKNHATQAGNTQPGDVKYADIDGNGVVNGKDRIITGRSVPKYNYSFKAGFSYKRFDLNLYFQGVQGINSYPVHNIALPLFNGAGITKNYYENSWTPTNRGATYPRFTLPKRGSRNNYKNSTLWLRDASYLRLKNLQIGYSIPAELLNVRKLEVFANARNLLTITNYPDFGDPENVGSERLGRYPSSRIYSVGLNVSF